MVVKMAVFLIAIFFCRDPDKFVDSLTNKKPNWVKFGSKVKLCQIWTLNKKEKPSPVNIREGF